MQTIVAGYARPSDEVYRGAPGELIHPAEHFDLFEDRGGQLVVASPAADPIVGQVTTHFATPEPGDVSLATHIVVAEDDPVRQHYFAQQLEGHYRLLWEAARMRSAGRRQLLDRAIAETLAATRQANLRTVASVLLFHQTQQSRFYARLAVPKAANTKIADDLRAAHVVTAENYAAKAAISLLPPADDLAAAFSKLHRVRARWLPKGLLG